MPVDSPPIATRLGKPGDLRHPVADRNQRLSTVAAATQANTRDLAEWHVDHTAHSQLAVVRSTFSHGRGFSASLKELDLISELFAQFRSNGNVRFESKADIEVS